MNKIGMNIHGANVRNRGVLFSRLYALRPPVVLVLDSLGLAQDIKAKLPETLVIFREYEGDSVEIHKKHNPEQWLDNHASQATGGIVIHVGNEMPFDKPTMEWLLRVCNRAVVKDVTVCIGNWAVGNPEPEAWPLAEQLLRFASSNRKHVIIGLHEYAGGVITSGLHGGYPDNAGVKGGQPGGVNLIQPESWPKDISTITCYHMGRYKFLLDYCKSIGIAAPRIVITEAGFDDTSDIKPWLETLKKTSNYQNIRGWRTLERQWSDWYGRKGWTSERAYAEQMIHSDKYWYALDCIEGRCLFAYAQSSEQWGPFNTEDAVEFWDLVVKYSKESTPQEVEPMPMPKPSNASDKKLVILTDAPEGEINVRTGPGEEYRAVGKVKNGERFNVYFTPPVSDRKGRKWFYVSVPGIPDDTWVCEIKPNIFVRVENGTTPAPTVPAPPPPLDFRQDVEALEIIIKELQDEVSEINHRLVKITTRLRLLETVRDDLQKAS